MMNNHRVPEYTGAGISDYMIPEISILLGKYVISSSNVDGGGFRTPDATKVWGRLEKAGKANYNREKDFYSLIIEEEG